MKDKSYLILYNLLFVIFDYLLNANKGGFDFSKGIELILFNNIIIKKYNYHDSLTHLVVEA